MFCSCSLLGLSPSYSPYSVDESHEIVPVGDIFSGMRTVTLRTVRNLYAELVERDREGARRVLTSYVIKGIEEASNVRRFSSLKMVRTAVGLSMPKRQSLGCRGGV